MNVALFNNDVSKNQLKQYADCVCFSQVGLDTSQISTRLDLPEYLVSAWLANWRVMDQAMVST